MFLALLSYYYDTQHYKQFIQILWFFMICRVAWRVVSGQGAEDTRSDDEEYVVINNILKLLLTDEPISAESSEEEYTPKTPIPPHSDLKKRRWRANISTDAAMTIFGL